VSDESANETEIPPERAAGLVADGAQLIDVRRAYEWDGGRIEGAHHIEMNELSAAAQTLDRDRPLVFYCLSGNRSGMAAAAFREAGFEAYNLTGGIEAWVAEGRPLDPSDGEIRAPLPAS
jgi:rhodanese-related sulfurtransferase